MTEQPCREAKRAQCVRRDTAIALPSDVDGNSDGSRVFPSRCAVFLPASLGSR